MDTSIVRYTRGLFSCGRAGTRLPARERICQWPKTSVPDPIEGGIYFDSPKEEEYLNFGSQIDMYLNISTLDTPTETRGQWPYRYRLASDRALKII